MKIASSITILKTILFLFVCVSTASAEGELKFAELGDFKLESGEVIRDCRLGYRVFGTLNSDKSNAVLFPTWFTGKSEQLAGNFGQGKMVDSSKFFIIAVDAIGNGVSTSPSNSKHQPGEKFPQFNIRDMVNAEYELVTRILGIKQLYAVMGISMGGMQTFQWVVSYPEMMTKAVTIVGTTHQTAYDLLLWSTELRAIEEARKSGKGSDAALPMLARIHSLALFTPGYRNSHTSPVEFSGFIEKEEQEYLKSFKADDWASQLKAMMAHNIAKGYGSLSESAWHVKAKILVIVARQDMMVNPDPAIDFARLIKAEVMEVNNNCGHVYSGCDGKAVDAGIARFLNN